MTHKTMCDPLLQKKAAGSVPTGLAASGQAWVRIECVERNDARFLELGFLAERGCLSEKAPPRKVA